MVQSQRKGFFVCVCLNKPEWSKIMGIPDSLSVFSLNHFTGLIFRCSVTEGLTKWEAAKLKCMMFFKGQHNRFVKLGSKKYFAFDSQWGTSLLLYGTSFTSLFISTVYSPNRYKCDFIVYMMFLHLLLNFEKAKTETWSAQRTQKKRNLNSRRDRRFLSHAFRWSSRVCKTPSWTVL